MKLLHISGSDFAASEFENKFGGKKLKEVLESKEFEVFKQEDEYTEFQILEFNEIDPAFIKFIRNCVMDYDGSKHNNFYLENEIIGE